MLDNKVIGGRTDNLNDIFSDASFLHL